jgi:hypothetical protein
MWPPSVLQTGSVSRRRGRRAVIGLGYSVLAHAILLAIVTAASGHRTPAPANVAIQQKIGPVPVDVVRQMLAKQPAAAESTVAVQQYTATPEQAARSKTERRRQLVRTVSTDTESLTHEQKVERLQRALALRQDGVEGPAYAVDELSVSTVWAIVRSGHGRVIIGRFPLDSDMFQVGWNEGGPIAFTPLRGSEWTGRVSSRAIQLSAALSKRALQRLRDSGGKHLDDGTAFLFVSPSLDLLVFSEQIAAAQRAQVPLDRIHRTVGRFRLTATGIDRFVINSIELVDGAVVSLS